MSQAQLQRAEWAEEEDEARPALSGPRLALWTYGADLPSFRYRLRSALPTLEARGWHTDVEELPKGRYFLRIWERRRELAASDVLILAKTRLGLGENRLLASAAPAVVFDFDDAIYVKQPRRPGQEAERSWLRRLKFAQTCRVADLVIAGSEELAAEARRHARRVEVLPTPVDLERYPPARSVERDAPPVAVWIGRPENLLYLELVHSALAELARRYPGFKLRVISSSSPDWSDVPIESLAWSPEAELEGMRDATVGLGPLSDDEWARGKCAFKLLQYMAAGLPLVASPVGANREVTVDGETGYLATRTEEWVEATSQILADRGRARQMGEAARARIARLFDVRVIAPRLADLLASVVGSSD